MQGHRTTWTDERLGDLSERMDAGFSRVDSSLVELGRRIDLQGTELRTEIGALRSDFREELGTQTGRVDALSGRIDALSIRMDALQRTMLQVGGAMIGAILATLATVLATSL